jgi:uncharacterized membrane protein YdjX (TVP38/TMEM64 family)
VVLVVLYTIACLLLLPGSVVTLAAGFMFGIVWGTVTASLGATLGATAAFIVGRFMIRGWIERHLVTHPGFLAMDRAIGGQGFKIVLLTRLCSLFPYDLMSYLFGLTRVPLGQYVLATWLGRLPETLLFVYLGTTTKSLADLAAGKVAIGVAKQILFGMGLVAMIAVAVSLAQIARQALGNVVGNPDRDRTPSPDKTDDRKAT